MSQPNHYGLILAGGRGTRFWPRSRKRHAKQVLNVHGDRTLIQATVERLAPLIPADRIWILTNEFVREEIVRQLPDVPPNQIIAEPAQRNTAPPIALAAHILHSIDPRAVFGVFPSDHVITDHLAYVEHLRPAFAAAEQGKMAVLGIKPRWAETGYGYIEFPEGTAGGELKTLPVASFREKPDPPVAKQFLDAGHFFWNAGMFFWSAKTVLEAMRAHLPKTAELIASLPAFGHADFDRKLAEVFPRCDSISVDYGIMEKEKGTGRIVGVACGEFGWNDVGSWNAVYELLPSDEHANSSRSELLLHDATGNYVDAGGKMVALLGVKDLIIVDTPDALLVADRNRAQEVGDLVKRLEKANRDEFL